MSHDLVHIIEAGDVGHVLLRIGRRCIPVSSFMGRILPRDVGKRVYLVDGTTFQVENDEQMAKRRAREKAR